MTRKAVKIVTQRIKKTLPRLLKNKGEDDTCNGASENAVFSDET